MFFNKKEKEISVYDYGKDVILAYLKKRYGIDFLPKAMYDDINRVDFRAYPVGGDRDKDEVKVILSQDDAGNLIIKDDFFFETIRAEYDAFIKEQINEFFSSYKVFYGRKDYLLSPDEVNVGDTFEIIRKNDINLIVDIIVFVDDENTIEDFTNKYNELLDRLYYINVHGGLKVAYINKGTMEKLNEENFRECLRNIKTFKGDLITKKSEVIISTERRVL